MNPQNTLQVEIIAEQSPGPPKVGRVEIQQGATEPNFLAMLDHCNAIRDRDHKGVALAGYRYERVLDGATVPHYVLYATYDPPGAPTVQLNPYNLNDAPQYVLGQLVEGNSLGDIGRKEQKF